MAKPVITVEVLKNENDLWALENAFLKAVGEEPMSMEKLRRLARAVDEEKITFFAARMGEKLIGMCSVSKCFSTFACKDCGVFDDFFVMPQYRGNGIARMLVNAAQRWCEEQDYASMMVGCSSGDVDMYRSLGFDVELGTMLVHNF